MTCEEIALQIAELTAQFDVLDANISSSTSTANSQYLTILASDNFGGTYPQQPLTSTAIQARITYLMPMQPASSNVLALYMTLLALVISIEGLKATQAQVVALLGGFKQQAIDQGCP